MRHVDLPRQGPRAGADRPHIPHGLVGARYGRMVTKAVRPPVRPGTRRLRMLRVKARASHHALADPTRIAKATS